MSELELATAVQVVRDELLAAAARGAGQAVQFEVGPIEMEFAVEIRMDASAKAGFRAWVISADIGGSAGRTSEHRVTITLTPKDAKTGRSLLISDAAGQGGPGAPLGSVVDR
jgi:Trypsin-co-occurring domain 2